MFSNGFWSALLPAVALTLAGVLLLMRPAEIPVPYPMQAEVKQMVMPMPMNMNMDDMDMSSATAVEAITPVVGHALTFFEFVTINGIKVTASDLRGSVVLLDVWASWCGPCKQEMPEFENLYQRYRSRGLRVLGVSIDMTAEDARAFASQVGVSYPIIHRPSIMGEWGLLGLPTTLIIDRDGIIRRLVVGFEYLGSFEQSIRELL
jgi:thiol-disulfide isomerase/thioredoxin